MTVGHRWQLSAHSTAVELSELDDFVHSFVVEVVDMSATKRQNKILYLIKQNRITLHKSAVCKKFSNPHTLSAVVGITTVHCESKKNKALQYCP